jgi:uncharacterized protein (TIGR00369 family)
VADEQRADEAPYKDMDRWLGDGGMAVIEAIGGSFTAYRPEWCEGTWVPTALACNPHGILQAGVHGIILDAAMNFAINAGLKGKDRTRATIQMSSEYLRGGEAGQQLRFSGKVTRMTKLVAFAEAEVTDAEGAILSRATGTFLIHRP